MTLTQNSIGQKIKYFRKRSGLSQSALELEINAAPGSISRIESGQVNPTKETVIQIAEALKMNYKELDYIIGITSKPASEEEIAEAVNAVERNMNQLSVFAYLIDERWCFHKISRGFEKVTMYTKGDIDWYMGKSTVEALLLEGTPLRKIVDPDYWDELVYNHLRYYYSQISFMEEDETVDRTIRLIYSQNNSRKIWSDIRNEGLKVFHEQEIRKIIFSFPIFKGRLKIPMYFTREPLFNHSRFEFVEYRTEKKFFDILISSEVEGEGKKS